MESVTYAIQYISPITGKLDAIKVIALSKEQAKRIAKNRLAYMFPGGATITELKQIHD